jgi:hypothetical protein
MIKECDGCGLELECTAIYDEYLCESCAARTIEITNEIEERMNKMPELSGLSDRMMKEIDSTIRISTDVFNAKMLPIEELRKQIEADDSIENKHFKLAEFLTQRFTHLKKVVFEKKTEMEVMAAEQRAIQVYLNNLANKLKQEEREKLRIQDINYKPDSPKKVKTPSLKKKIDKKEIRKYALELGIEEYTLQIFCISKNISVADAAFMIKKQIDEAKNES